MPLKALKETRDLESAMTGQRLSEWIFLGPTRQRMSNELVRKAFRACLIAADLRQVRFHDLRHTFASLLIQQGANPKYIQQELGHGSISITLDIYSHLFQGDHRHHIHQLDDRQGVANSESATPAQPGKISKSDSPRPGVQGEF
jgi:integrase